MNAYLIIMRFGIYKELSSRSDNVSNISPKILAAVHTITMVSLKVSAPQFANKEFLKCICSLNFHKESIESLVLTMLLRVVQHHEAAHNFYFETRASLKYSNYFPNR